MGDIDGLSSCVLGMKFKGSSLEKPYVCEVCQNSKSHNTPVSNNRQPQKSEKLELVFAEVLRTMPTTSLGGQRFAISFVYSFTRFGVVFFCEVQKRMFGKILNFKGCALK